MVNTIFYGAFTTVLKLFYATYAPDSRKLELMELFGSELSEYLLNTWP